MALMSIYGQFREELKQILKATVRLFYGQIHIALQPIARDLEDIAQ